MDIDKMIKEAILEKNGAKKEAYRAIKAELLLIVTGKKAPSIIDEATEIKVIRKLISQREESIAMYEANSRQELADMYKEQNKYLKELLPPEISNKQIQETIYGLYPNGFTQKEMGKVIKSVKGVYPTADSKLIAETVKENIHE
jgi:uncharacterized protein YqeY